MNDNLIRQIEKAGISQYKLSRETGIPYTTLSRLKRGTLDINNCTSEVVYRLSLYLGCGMEEILNPVRFLSGIKGTYKGYSYHWEVEGNKDVLVIGKGNKELLRDPSVATVNRKYYNSSKVFAEMEIDIRIEKEEADILCKNTD